MFSTHADTLTQQFEVDFEDTFAFIARFDILRLFMTIVVLKNLECHQVDVNNVFIEFFLKKTIYMIASFELKISFNKILRVLRLLYELKQVARDWHNKCVKMLLKLDFQ